MNHFWLSTVGYDTNAGRDYSWKLRNLSNYHRQDNAYFT